MKMMLCWQRSCLLVKEATVSPQLKRCLSLALEQAWPDGLTLNLVASIKRFLSIQSHIWTRANRYIRFIVMLIRDLEQIYLDLYRDFIITPGQVNTDIYSTT